MTRRFAYLIATTCLLVTLPTHAGETFREPVSGIEFVQIPGGCFFMGTDVAGELREGLPIRAPGLDEVPRHEVCVSDFWLGKSEVTRGQWVRVTQQVRPGVDRPVVDVSWQEAVSFGEQLSAQAGGTYRLPTEAEWEYACHAGVFVPATQPLGEERLKLLEKTSLQAWYRYQSGRDPEINPVMKKAANAWGLYDMLGNVWEWTLDGYEDAAYSRHARENPRQPAVDGRRVIRGGSIKTDLARVRCGARNFAPAIERSRLIGFRIVREAAPVEAAPKTTR